RFRSFEAGSTGRCRGKPVVPEVIEHRPRRREQLGRRPKVVQQRLEFAFNYRPTDRLAVALATLRWTEIVRIACVLALGPAGRERRAAVTADDGASQRKVRAQILARRRLGIAGQAVLDRSERLEADQRLMMALAQRHARLLDGWGSLRSGVRFGRAVPVLRSCEKD